MYRLEQQLALLPRVFARALQECDRRDPGQKKAVGDRVKEIRADYLCKLHESNERLRKLNQLPHDLSQLDGVEVFQVVAVSLGMTDRAGAEVRRRKRKGRAVTAAQQLNVNWSVYGELEPDEEALENDGNFEVLAGMGLLSSRATDTNASSTAFDAMAGIREDGAATEEADETNPFLSAADPVYGNQVGISNNEDEQDYCDIKDLLRELDDEIVETTVTVSELMEWTPTDGTASFQDLLQVKAKKHPQYPCPKMRACALLPPSIPPSRHRFRFRSLAHTHTLSLDFSLFHSISHSLSPSLFRSFFLLRKHCWLDCTPYGLPPTHHPPPQSCARQEGVLVQPLHVPAVLTWDLPALLLDDVALRQGCARNRRVVL